MYFFLWIVNDKRSKSDCYSLNQNVQPIKGRADIGCQLYKLVKEAKDKCNNSPFYNIPRCKNPRPGKGIGPEKITEVIDEEDSEDTLRDKFYKKLIAQPSKYAYMIFKARQDCILLEKEIDQTAKEKWCENIEPEFCFT